MLNILSWLQLLLAILNEEYMAASLGEQTASSQDTEKGAPRDTTGSDGQNTSYGDDLNPNSDNSHTKIKTTLSRIASRGISLQRTRTVEEYGKRPACFSSTTQEFLFVLTATMAVAQSSIIIGVIGVVTSHIAIDLDMTQAEVTWITAASS